MQTTKLKSRIVEAGYTQRTLADELGMSANSLGRKINGKAIFNTEEVIRICDKLGIVEDAEKAFIFLH